MIWFSIQRQCQHKPFTHFVSQLIQLQERRSQRIGNCACADESFNVHSLVAANNFYKLLATTHIHENIYTSLCVCVHSLNLKIQLWLATSFVSLKIYFSHCLLNFFFAVFIVTHYFWTACKILPCGICVESEIYCEIFRCFICFILQICLLFLFCWLLLLLLCRLRHYNVVSFALEISVGVAQCWQQKTLWFCYCCYCCIWYIYVYLYK